MWKVFRGDVEVAQAQEVFGAICVDQVGAEKVLQASGLAVGQGRTMPGVAGEIERINLYRLDDLVRLNGLAGGGSEARCKVDRSKRTFTLPAAAAEQHEPETEQ